MGIIIGSARIDENGHISGGKAGDQTGREVSTQTFYMHSKGWVVLRPKDPIVANKMAIAMEQACNNNHIGYDQNNRNGAFVNAKKYGSLGRIPVNTETDCSGLVRACIWQATGKDVGNFNTASEKSVLSASGLFEPAKTVTSSNDVRNGDVLVTKTKGHTVIVVSGRARKVSKKSSGNNKHNKYVFGDFVEDVQKAIGTKKVDRIPGPETLSKTVTISRHINNRHPVVLAVQKRFNVLGYDCGREDGIAGKMFEAATKRFQSDNGCVVDGEITAQRKTWRKLLHL